MRSLSADSESSDYCSCLDCRLRDVVRAGQRALVTGIPTACLSLHDPTEIEMRLSDTVRIGILVSQVQVEFDDRGDRSGGEAVNTCLLFLTAGRSLRDYAQRAVSKRRRDSGSNARAYS